MPDEKNPPSSSEEMLRKAKEKLSNQQSDATESEVFAPTPPPSREDSTIASGAAERSQAQSPPRPAPPSPVPPPHAPETGPSWWQRIPIWWVAVGLFVVGGWVIDNITSAERDDSGQVIEAGDLDSDKLAVGDCLLYPDEVGEDGSFEFESIEAVPCSEPHDMEIFGQATAPAGVYPGKTGLSNFGDEQCPDQFESYVGHPIEHDARLVYSVSYPVEESWDDGDRGIDCILEAWDQSKLIGSQQGVGFLGFGGLVLTSCYDYTEESSSVSFEEIPCSDPHLVQLFAVSVMGEPETADYPGDAFIESTADETCLPAFESLNPDASELSFFWVAPDGNTWPNGDRLVQCFLAHPEDEPFSGSYEVTG